jgi:hypothetical protein
MSQELNYRLIKVTYDGDEFTLPVDRVKIVRITAQGPQGIQGIRGETADVTPTSVGAVIAMSGDARDQVDARITIQKGTNGGLATLDSGGKVPISQLPSTVMEFKGAWIPGTNTPSLADGTGNSGDVYLVTSAGSVNLGSGSIAFLPGDWVVYNGSVWQKSLNSNAVVSVNGLQGVVVLDAAAVGADPAGTAVSQQRTYIGTTTPAAAGPWQWWDTSGGNLTLWIEDGL